jgi:hypothetical protein
MCSTVGRNERYSARFRQERRTKAFCKNAGTAEYLVPAYEDISAKKQAGCRGNEGDNLPNDNGERMNWEESIC